MASISKIVVGCHRHDLWLLRMCIASIRYWYDDIEIALLKDVGNGEFDTSEIEKGWRVSVIDVGRPVRYGSPVAKCEVLYLEEPERIFFLDSDHIMVGRVLEALEERGEDFVVSGNAFSSPENDHITTNYYDWWQLKNFDPAFAFPGYVFNSGQFVATGALIRRQEIERFYDPPGSGTRRWPTIFMIHDQGVLNYVLPKLEQEGRLTIGCVTFELFAHPSCIGPEAVSIESQESCRGLPKVIHYAGEKFPLNSQCLRPDLLNFYETFYYSRVSFGSIRRSSRAIVRLSRWAPKQFSRWAYQRMPRRLRGHVKSLRHRFSRIASRDRGAASIPALGPGSRKSR